MEINNIFAALIWVVFIAMVIFMSAFFSNAQEIIGKYTKSKTDLFGFGISDRLTKKDREDMRKNYLYFFLTFFVGIIIMSILANFHLSY